MDWLERELQQALERKMPPDGFAARVSAAAGKRRSFAPRWWMGAAAAVVLLLAGGSLEYREYRGRVAKERVLLALRITAGQLHYIQQRVQRESQGAPVEVRQ
ncbi:MAG TPA: hypothetical protein VME43_03430 [Bryobacteraceae bacterium]|nr:hypothetical protein [Bryobacteraceae bacterium]